jgi:hypothetical protein
LKRKSLHPADADTLGAIARARAFTASLFLGAGKYAHAPESPSLAGARRWGVLCNSATAGAAGLWFMRCFLTGEASTSRLIINPVQLRRRQ